jgi:hypothetical protein
MKKGYKKISMVLLALSLAFSGCQSIPTISQRELDASYIKKVEAEAQIEELNKAHSDALIKNAESLSVTKDSVIDGQGDQLQAGANALYTIQQTSMQSYQPGTLEFIRDRSIEGFTAMGKPPSIQEILDGNARYMNYIATFQRNDSAEIAKLKAEHERLVLANGVLVATTEIAKQEVEVVKQEKVEIEKKYIEDKSTAQTKLNEANDLVINKEHQRAEQERIAKEKVESFKALIKQLMLWCGIAALAALAGAIFSPIGKGGLGAIASVLGTVTVVLPFIEPWMIWILLGVVVLAGGATISNLLFKHRKAEVANSNMINAIQDTKEKPGATIEDLKENLREWNTRYVTDKDGKVTTISDTSIVDGDR